MREGKKWKKIARQFLDHIPDQNSSIDIHKDSYQKNIYNKQNFYGFFLTIHTARHGKYSILGGRVTGHTGRFLYMVFVITKQYFI